MTPTQIPPQTNADPAELAKFSALAHRWWDPESELTGPLHRMNPLRLDWIERVAGGLAGKRVLDVGCGGGILSEGMALRGAAVTGIDLADKALGVARLHGLESGVAVEYRLVSVESLAQQSPSAFDAVTCMEMLEHVPAPASALAACGRLVRPGGVVAISTINRNVKAYLLAVLGAEYVLGLLPRGTHDYAKFITPAEAASYARTSGLEPFDIAGLAYNPFARTFSLGRDTDVNYLMAFRRSG
jgi:2-polyprenyl-6-hydroxyphenyl methylase/3-demethylubiquinone-9 3-methyltransferase